MNRLRESREYVGYAVEEVALHLAVAPARVLEMEAGAGEPLAPETLRALSRLYLRPPGYLLGTEPEGPVPEAVTRLLDTSSVSPADRAEIERFARFLGARPSAA